LNLVANILAVGLSFILCSIFTPMVRGLAVRLDIGDKPNGRTSRNIAHIGGIAIISAILFTLIVVFMFFLEGLTLSRIFSPIFVASGFLIFLIGIVDDLRSLHYSYKLVLQIMVSIFVSLFGIILLNHFGVVRFNILWGIFSFIIVAFWMLGITTSFNLVDGLDGLATGLAIIYAISFAIAGFIFRDPLVVALSLVVVGAMGAFLKFNFPPAKIFMGDSGSLFIGLIFGLLPLLLVIGAQKVFFVSAGSLIVLSIPVLDTMLAFTRRLLRGRPVFEADHMHIHHILLYSLKSVRKVDFVEWFLAGIHAYLGLSVMQGSLGMLVVALSVDVMIFVVALRVMIGEGIKEGRLLKILEH